MDWTHLTEDGDKWRAFVDTVMSLGVTLNAGNFLSMFPCEMNAFILRNDKVHELCTNITVVL